MRHLVKTQVSPSDGADLARGIADVSFLQLGGVPQWVMIRGDDVRNPPLILLHGGPGMSETFLFQRFIAPLEKHFTLVYWDQRGSGRSFDRTIPRSSMTVERFISDLDELVDYVRGRVGHEHVVLFGHSWGSALGVLYAARFPEKVAAYVGSGQIGSSLAGESASYAFALAEAERAGKGKAVERLRAIGPPPYDADALWTQRMLLSSLTGQTKGKTLLALGRMLFAWSGRAIGDLLDLYRGFRFSIDAMWDETSTIDLNTAVPSLQMPVLFFLGRQDHWVPPETSVDYFEKLDAPSRQLVWFEESGHEPFADEAERFNAMMIELVRPLA